MGDVARGRRDLLSGGPLVRIRRRGASLALLASALAGCAGAVGPRSRSNTTATTTATATATATATSTATSTSTTTSTSTATSTPGVDAGPASPPVEAGYRAVLKAVGAPATSLGHAGGLWKLTRFANDAGARALAGDSVEALALVVAEHVSGSAPGPVLVMQKRGPGYDPSHGDWYYAVLTSDLRALREGKLADCEGCHATARRDHLFGPR